MSNFYFPDDLFGEFDRLQRQMSSLFSGFPTSLRSGPLGAFPPVNIGSTDDTIEIVAFAPGLDPAAIDVSIDKGLLTISGERSRTRCLPSAPQNDLLPRTADPDKVQARYTVGCLTISVGKREASKPRAITVQ